MIIEGQGTDRISVATEGLEGRRLTATVAMRIVGEFHTQETSCETEVPGQAAVSDAPPPNKALQLTAR